MLKNKVWYVSCNLSEYIFYPVAGGGYAPPDPPPHWRLRRVIVPSRIIMLGMMIMLGTITRRRRQWGGPGGGVTPPGHWIGGWGVQPGNLNASRVRDPVAGDSNWQMSSSSLRVLLLCLGVMVHSKVNLTDAEVLRKT